MKFSDKEIIIVMVVKLGFIWLYCEDVRWRVYR